MLVDYHVHLERAGLSRANAMRFVDRALANGVWEIAFTEHAYNFVECAPMLERPNYVKEHGHGFRLDDYISLIEDMKAEGLSVKLGIEFDYIDETIEDVADFLEEGHPWDLVIGSVHWIGEWGFDIDPTSWNDVDVEWAYSAYFERVCRAARSGVFDVIGHPDVIKVFGARLATGLEGPDEEGPLRGYYDALTAAAASSGTCLEVSSAGLRRPVEEAYPAMTLLKMACERGVGITLASDAHEPEEVASRYDELVSWAREAGYTKLTIFDQRTGRQAAMG
jgi:histidinol-phosphatase (PHP family)